jgi:hypothetical protein
MAAELVESIGTRMSNWYVRSGLLRAARDYARHGWPVVPGSWWSPAAGRHVCDIPGCFSGGLHPGALDTGPVSPLSPPVNLRDFALTSEIDIGSRWREHPYTILMPTGITCDVMELAASTAEAIWPSSGIASLHSPVATLSTVVDSPSRPQRTESVVFIFTQTGESISSDTLDELTRHRVVLHREGSWIPLPPSTVSGRTTRWINAPRQCSWQTPPLAQLSQHILRRLVQLRSRSLPPEQATDWAA